MNFVHRDAAASLGHGAAQSSGSKFIASEAISGLPVFVINLERDTERRQYMTQLLDRLGMHAEFVTAVDGRTLSAADREAYDPRRALRVYGVSMLDSEIGCFLSHYRLYERMVRDGIGTALIMEDDVRVDPALPRIARELLDCAVTDWTVIRLDSKRDQVLDPRSTRFRGIPVATLSGGEKVYRLRTRVLGVGAYLIRQEGARRMLDYGQRIFMPIDQTMDRYWENGILPYVVRPFPVHQRDDFGSNTGSCPSTRRNAQPWAVRLERRLQRAADGISKRMFNLTH
ncbi:MAG: glycosyltransferase family 25 protein [Acetobacteraceae bacterium]|nr:glycosyltransferase family 25 protein [Acetobacteraceae bacterium]